MPPLTLPRGHSLVALAVILLPAACGSGLEGTYSGANTGFLDEITFRSGDKVDVKFMGMTREGTYKREGDRVTVTVGNDTQVLTLRDDGCLDGGGLIGSYCKAGKSSKSASAGGDKSVAGTWAVGGFTDKLTLQFDDDGKVQFTMESAGEYPQTAAGTYEVKKNRVIVRGLGGPELELTRQTNALVGNVQGQTLRFERQ